MSIENRFPTEANQMRGARAAVTADVTARFMRRVYNWMMAGLGLTAIIAYVTVSDQALLSVVAQPMVFFPLILVELGLVVWLSARIEKMSMMTAMTAFMGYAALNGLTLSLILFAYTASSVFQAFAITATSFGALSLYGYVTKRDLSGLGSFLFVGLIGIVLASVVNIFFHNPMITWVVNYLGVLIFAGLIAYDTQRLKSMAMVAGDQGEMATKLAVHGALSLYLDFLNMFIFLLQIVGNRE